MNLLVSLDTEPIREGYTRADPHVHTRFSPDSSISPRDLVLRARAVGLGLLVVTDHGTVRGALEVRKHAQDIVVVPGIEVSTPTGDIIGLFVDENLESGRLVDVLDRIRSAGGLAVLPHPFRAHTGNIRGLMASVDAVEIFNGRCSVRENEAAAHLAGEVGKPALAGSDAHILSFLGTASTSFPGDTAEDFRRAIVGMRVVIDARYPSLAQYAHDLWARFWSMPPSRRRALLSNPEKALEVVAGRLAHSRPTYSPDKERVPER